MKIIITFALFFLLRMIFRVKMGGRYSRHLYALLTSFSLALVYIILSVMFLEKDTLYFGISFSILVFIGGFAFQYLAYPIFHKPRQ